jgi:hypothetical protein
VSVYVGWPHGVLSASVWCHGSLGVRRGLSCHELDSGFQETGLSPYPTSAPYRQTSTYLGTHTQGTQILVRHGRGVGGVHRNGAKGIEVWARGPVLRCWVIESLTHRIPDAGSNLAAMRWNSGCRGIEFTVRHWRLRDKAERDPGPLAMPRAEETSESYYYVLLYCYYYYTYYY